MKQKKKKDATTTPLPKPSVFKGDKLKGAGWEYVLRIQTHPWYCNLLYSQCMLSNEVILNAEDKFFLLNENTLRYLQILGVTDCKKNVKDLKNKYKSIVGTRNR